MLSIIRNPHLRRATALLLALVLCLSPLGVIADTYDVSKGDVTVTATGDTQTVTGFSVEKNNQVDQTDPDPVITGTSTGRDANTVTITAGAGAEANVTLDGLNIDTREYPTDIYTLGDAALTVSGEGTVNIELNGDSTLTSGFHHAGLEKQGHGELVIGDDTGTDGSLTANGGMGGAGIGGYEGNGTNINITGGTVTATGGAYGAGLGGGHNSTGTDITLTVGEVTANGGIGGAGIGGGWDGDGKTITITGGTVTAQGGIGGAGIGGGYKSTGTDITITGGTVTAQGGLYGAGIGGGTSGSGADGNGDSIQIIGGTVIAVGGREAAGIGGGVVAFGTGGNGTNITISGSAEVFVASGDQQDYGPAAAIGNGGKENATESIEVEPDPAALNCDGSITYYEAGTTAKEIQEGTGTLSAEHEPNPVTGHKAGTPQKENEKPATCTESGSYDEVVYCTECKQELSRVTKEIPALGHDLTHHEAKAATCTEVGWEAYDTCENCNYSTYKEIPAKGHTWSDWTTKQAATCTTVGTEIRTCSACGAEETRTIDALGHDLVHHDAKAATCTEAGWEAYDTCSRCSYTTYKEIPAKGHTPGAAVKENEVSPQVGVAGSYDEVIYCTACEAELSREKRTVDPLPEPEPEPEPTPVNVPDPFTAFCQSLARRIRTAGENETVQADASMWPGLHRVVFEALKDRPDVTLTLTCHLNGALTELTVPAGFDLMTPLGTAPMLTFEQISRAIG